MCNTLLIYGNLNWSMQCYNAWQTKMLFELSKLRVLCPLSTFHLSYGVLSIINTLMAVHY